MSEDHFSTNLADHGESQNKSDDREVPDRGVIVSDIDQTNCAENESNITDNDSDNDNHSDNENDNDNNSDDDTDSDNDNLGTVSQIGENCGDDSDKDAGDLNNSDDNDSDTDLESDINQYSDSDNDNNSNHGDSNDYSDHADDKIENAKYLRDRHKRKKKKSLQKRKESFQNWQIRMYNQAIEYLRNDDMYHFKQLWNDLQNIKHVDCLKAASDYCNLRFGKEGPYTSKHTAEGETLQSRKQEIVPGTSFWRDWYAHWPELQRNKSKYTISEHTFLLEVAAEHGSRHCLQFLLDLGYDPNVYRFVPSTANIDYGLPLHQAVKNEHKFCVEILLKAESLVNLPGCDSLTPLHIACELGNTDIIKLLMKTPDVLPYIGDIRGHNPITRMLYYAEDNLLPFSQFQKVVTTLKGEGCRPWVRNARGEAPLYVFVMSQAVCDDIVLVDATQNDDDAQSTPLLMLQFMQKLTDAVPNIDIRCGYEGSIMPRTLNHKNIKWDHLQQGLTALSVCASLDDPMCNNSAVCLLQANADHSIYCLISNKYFRDRLDQMDELSRHVLQTLCSTIDISDDDDATLYSLFEMGLIEENYVFPRLLVEAGHFVPLSVSLDEYEPFISEEEENQSLISLLQVLQGSFSLEWWCKRTIRKCLPKGYRTFRNALDTTAIPCGLKNFLSLAHLHV